MGECSSSRGSVDAVRVEIGAEFAGGVPALVYINDIPHEVTDSVEYIDHEGRSVTEYTAAPLARNTLSIGWYYSTGSFEE